MRRLQDYDRKEEHKTDGIDILINVCRIGALIFAASASEIMGGALCRILLSLKQGSA